MGNNKAIKRPTTRRAASFLAVLGMLVLSSGIALMVTATPANAAKVHKSYVCKYVGTPGPDEVLQTGQNPIYVDNHSIAGKDLVSVGDVFSDAQGFSRVIIANTLKLTPEPGVDACTSAPPSVDLATANVDFVNPTCASPNSGAITSSVDEATLTITPEKASYSVGDSVEVTATANSGAAFDDGAATMWSHTFTASDAPCTSVTPPVVSPPKPPAKHHTQAVTPTVVHAGLAGVTAEDMRGEQGLALMFAGMLMLVAAGGLGLRVRSSASRV
jgi:hypothetical protein